MKRFTICALIFLVSIASVYAQAPEQITSIFPVGTVLHQNIPYANDTLKKHLLDIYLPANAAPATPLIIWVHGGGWDHGGKYADMSYMKSTIKAIVEKGYALASIDYRQSFTIIFPGQLQDCIQAIEYLHNNAPKYKLDKNKFVLMGFSAGGHLASLLALSNNNNINEFYPAHKKPTYKIKAVLDFYGPSELLMFYSHQVPTDVEHSIAKMLGASPLARPDLSKLASPVTYVDKNDPPFFIIHGEKDPDVPTAQSYLLKSYLDLAGVKNELTVVKDAPHYGVMFDTEEVRTKLLRFLEAQFN